MTQHQFSLHYADLYEDQWPKAEDTTRMIAAYVDREPPTDPDATGFYDLTPTPVVRPTSPRRRRQIRDTRENVLRLREAFEEGWDIGPELHFEEQRLAHLMSEAA